MPVRDNETGECFWTADEQAWIAAHQEDYRKWSKDYECVATQYNPLYREPNIKVRLRWFAEMMEKKTYVHFKAYGEFRVKDANGKPVYCRDICLVKGWVAEKKQDAVIEAWVLLKHGKVYKPFPHPYVLEGDKLVVGGVPVPFHYEGERSIHTAS